MVQNALSAQVVYKEGVKAAIRENLNASAIWPKFKVSNLNKNSQHFRWFQLVLVVFDLQTTFVFLEETNFCRESRKGVMAWWC